MEAYFTFRRLDLNTHKLTQLREIGNVPELAHAAETLKVRCKDGSIQLNSTDSEFDESAELVHLSSMMALALNNFRNVKNIGFQPSPDGVGDQYTQYYDLPIMDYSGSFSFVLLVVQACGICPQHICQYSCDKKDFEAEFILTECESMLRLSSCFSDLVRFDLSVRAHDGTQEELEFASNLANGINLMQSFTRLTLDFSHAEFEDNIDSTLFFKDFAGALHLYGIVSLQLHRLVCDISDLTGLLIAHAKPLKQCRISCVASPEANSTMEFRTMLEKLQSHLCLDLL